MIHIMFFVSAYKLIRFKFIKNNNIIKISSTQNIDSLKISCPYQKNTISL